MNSKLLSFSLLLFVLITAGCGESSDNASSNNAFLPKATLIPHEILVVMDSSQWNGLPGEAIRDVFTQPIPGLPQEEGQFVLRHVRPQDLGGFLRRYPNILFAFTLDNQSASSQIMQSMFSKESLEQIKEDPKRYMLNKQDVFAKGQEVMYLFSETTDQLVSKIFSNRQLLLSYFEGIERKRNIREIADVKSTRNIGKMLGEKYGFTMRFPAGYEVAEQDSNFVWVRLLDNQVDKSVWITWKPYTSQEIFETEKLMEFRNSVAKKYIWGDDSTTYMRLEDQYPVLTEEVNFNGEYAIETRGLWRLENMVMGGPFISYAFADEATNRLYYIEGFTYAPGQDKRAAISELEATLWTFRRSTKQ